MPLHIGADVYTISGQAKYTKYWSQIDKDLDKEIEEIDKLSTELEEIRKEEVLTREDDDRKLELLKYTLEQDFSFTNARIPDTIIDAFVKEVIPYEDHFVWRLNLCEGDVSCLVEGTARKPRARLRESKTPSQADSDTGSTEDVSQFRFVLEKATEYGYKDAGFILDRGLFSDLSIEYMDACPEHIRFLRIAWYEAFC